MKNGVTKVKEFEHLIKYMWERKVPKYKNFMEVVGMFSYFS
jgi:hypothetical protein